MRGRISKGVAGSYVVLSENGPVICKPKGIFRNDKKKPLVGDSVEFDMLSDGTGVIAEILERTSTLIRPEVANATQAMLVFAITQPDPAMNLADRFLINMEMAHVPTFIVFNKADLADEKKIKETEDIFKGSGCEVFFVSAKFGQGIDEIKKKLHGQSTVLAGPSGVGKSTLTNLLQDEAIMETGELSEKILRGKNTTRHTQLLKISADSYIYDTPGFTSFYVTGINERELWKYYPEMADCSGLCRFTGCVHINEPDCEVKKRVAEGLISSVRYDNYKQIYSDIKQSRKY